MRRRTDEALLRVVEGLFLREVLTFEGEHHVALRLDGSWPDRSVFAVASLGGGTTLAVARVQECDLDSAGTLALVYLEREDMELVRAVARVAGRLRGPHG